MVPEPSKKKVLILHRLIHTSTKTLIHRIAERTLWGYRARQTCSWVVLFRLIYLSCPVFFCDALSGLPPTLQQQQKRMQTPAQLYSSKPCDMQRG